MIGRGGVWGNSKKGGRKIDIIKNKKCNHASIRNLKDKNMANTFMINLKLKIQLSYSCKYFH